MKTEMPVEPFQAPYWGFGKVIGLELPELRGALVDLPAAAEMDSHLLAALLRELVDGQKRTMSLSDPVGGTFSGSNGLGSSQSAPPSSCPGRLAY